MTKGMTLGGVLVAAALLAACGGGGAVAAGEGEGGGGDATAGGETTPGAARFRVVCGVCHGRDGSGGDAPRLTDLGWDAARMRTQIREGSGHMRPIPASRLSDDDLEQVLVWLGTIGAVQ